jgi:hypothetical protein
MNGYDPGYYYGSPEPIPPAPDTGVTIAVVVVIGLVLFVMIMLLIFWIFRRTGSGTLGGLFAPIIPTNNNMPMNPMIVNVPVDPAGPPINLPGTVPSIDTTCDSHRHRRYSRSSSSEDYKRPSRRRKHKKKEASSSSSESMESRHAYPDSSSRAPSNSGTGGDSASILSLPNPSTGTNSYTNEVKSRTSFAKASFRGNKCVEIPELKGTVDYMKCHEGALYVHVLGTKCSGIYKYRNAWECLLGTSDNQTGYSNNASLDTGSKSAIIHLSVTKDDTLGFGTLTQSYALIEHGRNVSVKKDSSSVCMDSHFNEESNARIDTSGIAYMNDRKVGLGQTNLSLHSRPRVRCYKSALIVMTDRNNLVSCQDREIKTISKNVSAYDVCNNHIAYTQRNKLSVTDPESKTITIDLPFNACHVATSNTHIYTST